MAILGLQGVRGGTGVTSITAALAWALQLLGESVLAQTTLRTPVSRSSGIVPLKSVWPEYVRCFAGWRSGKSCL